ncbi:MAG: AAA family ATPase, partial [Candidatus Eremiobacteraeota bacterium]|nr:AAA family ATPase [Candidatus Eremiobacteraeota bacterium]
MRLKELKVFGFKTFAEPTTIEFEPGITAIVGPNGSGKSNLVDAIRWALGEQSSKSLRSGRMDDVIFAGTTKRKPLGMVEVSLLFDNSDGRLPIDFNEVSVTRRGYRAGEIEYYINRNRVRLRDVLDLLGGTGLGAGSYSIVSQGQVDAILSSKPVERRALFEETAGINRFLSRKSEALRRLEQTEANAIRISDLIAELERRIPELDTAVRRAKRYRRLVTRVRELELVRYLRASASRREERARVRETLNLHEERQAATAAHAASLAAELSVVRTELYKQELALEERRVGGQEARALLAELQARFAALEARRDALDAQSRASTADQERASGERSGLGSALAALDARVAPLWARVEDARSVEARIAADVTAARAELDAGFNALREFESALAMTMASAAERRATIAGTEREIGRLREEIARLRAGREEAQREATADRERFARDEQDLLGLEREVVARADELSGLDAQAQADAAHLEALNVRLRHLHSEVASDAARLHTLEELEHSLEGHVPGTRAVIEASGRGELAGVRGVVSNVMRVDERYARALDVAFGTALSHIITETTSDARTALAYLSERELGRATFIPLDALNERPARQRPSLEGRAGVIGYADSLVQTQPVHAGVIAALVGAIAVVESLENALTLVREGACEGAVTLGGDLILGAAISGGRYRRERSILARRAQAEALRAKLPEKRDRLERLEQDVREATAASEMRNADRERVRLAHADALVTTTDARTRLEALGSEIERLDQTGDESAARERELARQLEEEQSRVATLERLADEHLERSGERERLEGDLARCRARVATAESQQREAALALAGAREAAG